MEQDNTPAVWEKDAVEWARKSGILRGDDKGDLALHASVTLAQLCVMLYRALTEKDV